MVIMHRLNKETIYHLLEADPEKPGAGRILDVCILVLIVANVILSILASRFRYVYHEGNI